MSHLIEVVFEEVFVDSVGTLLKELCKAGKHFTDYSLSADWEIEEEIDWQSAESITQFLKTCTNCWSFFINLSELNIIKHLSIKNCSIQVLQYDLKKYDVNLNFKWEDIRLRDSTYFVETLMKFSRKIAFKYGIVL